MKMIKGSDGLYREWFGGHVIGEFEFIFLVSGRILVLGLKCWPWTKKNEFGLNQRNLLMF